MTQYQRFRELTDELYPDCTLEQQLGVYVQHKPAAVVPFLLELITALEAQSALELHPEQSEDPTNDDQPSD